MKRFFVMVAVVGFLAAVPLSHLAVGKNGGKSHKVAICHVSDGGEPVDLDADGVADVVFGHVIKVSGNGNAVNAHLAHGDCLAAGAKGDGCACPLQ